MQNKKEKSYEGLVRKILKEYVTEQIAANMSAKAAASFDPTLNIKNNLQKITPTQTQQTSGKFGVTYKFTYPGDKSYVYGYKDGKWYAKNIAKNTEFDLQSSSKFKSSIDNLNKQFAKEISSNNPPKPTPTPPANQYNLNLLTKTQTNATDNTYVKPMVLKPVNEGKKLK